MSQQIEIESEAQMVAFGARLADVIQVPCVVSLVGPLGAGKTRLVQAVAEALAVAEEVTSPTFVLMNEYRTGRVPIYHLDAYRLKDADEFYELGLEEYFTGRVATGPGITFIEWGNRFAELLPPTTAVIQITPGERQARTIQVDGLAAELENVD